MDEIKKGDIVKLKSGGPVMTVEDIKDGKYATCVWFDVTTTGTTFKRADFDLITLMKAAAGR